MIFFAFELGGQNLAPGVPGLFVGMSLGSATHAALNLLLALRWIDFERAADVACERANQAAATTKTAMLPHDNEAGRGGGADDEESQ